MKSTTALGTPQDLGYWTLKWRLKKSKQKKKSVSQLRGFKSTETQTPTRHFVFSYFSNKHLWRESWFRNPRPSPRVWVCLRRLGGRNNKAADMFCRQTAFFFFFLSSSWLKRHTLVKIDPQCRSSIFGKRQSSWWRETRVYRAVMRNDWQQTTVSRYLCNIT